MKNIVYIITDQLRAQALQESEGNSIQTPNLNKLKAESINFETAVSNCPVCMPARSATMSGQYTRRCTGNLNNHYKLDSQGKWYFPDPPEKIRTQMLDKTLTEYLKDTGYFNALIGKWHLHPEPALLDFDYWCYPLAYHRYYQQCYFENDTSYIVDEFAPFFEAKKVDNFLSSRACATATDFETLRESGASHNTAQNKKAEQPFFLLYSISLPHMPLGQIPEEYENLYPPENISLRPNVFSGGVEKDREWFDAYISFYYRDQRVPVPKRLKENLDIRKITSLYNSFVHITDLLIGKLIASLKKYDLYENTLIVFTSDHGDMLGSHGMYNKAELYEESIRIPLMFRAEDLIPHTNHYQIAQTVDIMPTLLDYLSILNQSTTDGQSLLPILQRKCKTMDCNQAFIECATNKIGIRTSEYMYGLQINPDNGQPGKRPLYFYKMKFDPYQLNNLAENPRKEDRYIIQKLDNQLREIHQKIPWLNEKKTYRTVGVFHD